MSEGLGDKVQGKADEFGGKAKQVAGDVLGDNELKSEGATQEAAGKGEGFLGKVKDAAGDAADSVKGVFNTVGDKLGNKDKQDETAH